jgi:hypothetical protein
VLVELDRQPVEATNELERRVGLGHALDRRLVARYAERARVPDHVVRREHLLGHRAASRHPRSNRDPGTEEERDHRQGLCRPQETRAGSRPLRGRAGMTERVARWSVFRDCVCDVHVSCGVCIHNFDLKRIDGVYEDVLEQPSHSRVLVKVLVEVDATLADEVT